MKPPHKIRDYPTHADVYVQEDYFIPVLCMCASVLDSRLLQIADQLSVFSFRQDCQALCSKCTVFSVHDAIVAEC